MKLTKKGYYAVKALLDLSLQGNKQPHSVNAIAQRQNLPAPYLEKILIEMRKNGLVKSTRGMQGGYGLAKSPDEISLGDILMAVGENIEPLTVENVDRDSPENWVTMILWQHLNQKMKEAIFHITLSDLYYDARSRQASQGEDQHFII